MATPVSHYLKQKKFSGLVLIVIAVLLGGVGYVTYTRVFTREESPRHQQQTRNSLPTHEGEQYDSQLLTNKIDTSDWKIYHNEKHGFLFRYPPFLQGKESPDNPFLIFSLGYCEEAISDTTVHRCIKGGHFIDVYISERTFNKQNLLRAFDAPPADPSQSSLPFGMVRIGEKDIHIGANAVWNIEEWVAQMAFGDHTLSFRFQGDGFIKLNDESFSLEGLEKVKTILSTLEF